MRKKHLILAATISLGIVAAIFCGTYYFKDYLPGTVLGNTYNYKTLDKQIPIDIKNNYPVFDNENLNTYVTYNVNTTPLKNISFLKRITYAITRKNNKISYSVDFNKNKIITMLNLLNQNVIYSQNAYISKENGKWVLNDEVQGNFILVDDVIGSLNSHTKKINLNKFYLKPDITSKDLKNDYDELSKYQDWSCTYSNGETIKATADYVNYNNDTHKITINDTWIKSEAKKILKSYNTVGIERNFNTHDGKNIKISGGTWGSLPDTDKEIEYLKNKFKNGETITDRIPEYSYSYENFSNTYIEISIEQQHLWVYQNNQLIMETDIVTGDATKHRDTPTGCYFISEHINGKYLTGENYKTWVNKWMRLTNQGIGLHDAKWQPRFGGNRYKGHGSHGCINLPPEFASDLFDTVSTGWLVVIY